MSRLPYRLTLAADHDIQQILEFPSNTSEPPSTKLTLKELSKR